MFEPLIAGWKGERVLIQHDAESDSWIFVCMYSTAAGPAAGGTRMKVYPTPADGLADAMRLSEAMTLKLAMAGLPYGGGKAVLAVRAIPQDGERRRLLLRYGDTVAMLRGGFVTATDINTNEFDMDVVAERARPFVFGRSKENGGSGSSALPTAIGVFHGIRATAQWTLGRDLEGLTVLVQGVGGVGGTLVELLADAGAVVIVSDVDADRARSAAASARGRVVPADHAMETDCDVYAPCALGGTLNEATIPRLRCRIVAGSANNQLATPADGDRLKERGMVYAPDFVINVGGALGLIGLELLGWDERQMNAKLETIGDTLRDVYAQAERDGSSTAAAAERLAKERLAAAIARPPRDVQPTSH